MEITVDLKLLGRRIKEARKRCHLTQEQVGAEIGVSGSYLSRIETGKSQMSMRRFFTSAVLLQTQPGDLLVGCCPDIKPANSDLGASPEKSHMNTLMDRAPIPIQKNMCAVCEALLATAQSTT